MSWYPTQERTQAIERQLAALEAPFVDGGINQSEFLTESCSSIRDMLRNGSLSEALTRDWIIIAAHYRRFDSVSEAIRRHAGSGLLWLRQQSQNGHTDDDDVPALRWVTDLVRARIHACVPDDTLHKHLTDEELAATTERWKSFREDGALDINTITERLQPYLRLVGDMTSDFYFPGIRDQIRDLLEEVRKNGPAAASCRAALRYLGEKDDVISDELGYVGLLDDLYVIDVAHRELTGQVTWGPLLDRFIREWPFLEQLVFSDAGQETGLPPFMQMIAGAVLSSLQDKRNTYISLHETGPSALVSAFLVSIDSLRRQQRAGRFEERPLEKGDHVLLGDDTATIKAIYRGVDERHDQKFVFIELSRGALQGLPPGLMPTLRRAPSPHKRLSTGKAFIQWKNQEHPQLLHHFIGGDIHPDSVRPEVLLIVPRQDLEELLTTLRPMGSSIPELVGCQYLSRSGDAAYIRGNSRQRPMITVCSDPAVGSEFLSGCEASIRPSSIVCDATTLNNADLSSLVTSANQLDITTVVLGPRHAKDLRSMAEKNAFRIWPIAQNEIEPVSLGNPVGVPAQSGAIRRYTARQRLSTHVHSQVHLCQDETVQAVADALASMRALQEQDQDDASINVVILASEVLRLLRLDFAEFDDEHRRRLADAATLCGTHASTLALYDERIDVLARAMATLANGHRPSAKSQMLQHLMGSEADKRIGVLCSSYRVATLAREQRSDVYSGVEWVTFRELRSGLPLERLIVPGWLGRTAMRELGSSGFARRMEYIYYPFEQLWHTRSADAASRDYRRLDSDKEKIWRDLERKYRTLGNQPQFARPTPEPIQKPEAEDVIDDEVWITRAVTDMAKKRASAHAASRFTARARLILFEEPDYYIYAPPNGKVIYLSPLVDSQVSPQELDRDERKVLEDLIILPVSQIRPGALLAFPMERSSDAIDILSDRVLRNPRKTRSAVSLWRTALLRFATDRNLEPHDLAERLVAAGLTRTEHTVRNWLYSDSIIAPLNWRQEIPIIAKMTGDEPLLARMDETLKEIPKLYDARRKAAKELIKLFIDQQLNLGSDDAVLQVGEHAIHYRLLRVRTLGPISEVDGDCVGELQKLFTGEPTEQLPESLL